MTGGCGACPHAWQAFQADLDLEQKYSIAIKIGHGFTYSKYNTLMHFLNVAQCYWQNPDLNSIQARVYCARRDIMRPFRLAAFRPVCRRRRL